MTDHIHEEGYEVRFMRKARAQTAVVEAQAKCDGLLIRGLHTQAYKNALARLRAAKHALLKLEVGL